MFNSLEVPTKDVAQIIKATFPSYRKRKVHIRACETVSLQDLNWSGGTRSEYRACTLDGKSLGGLDRFNAMAPWDSRQIEGVSLPLMAGAVVVRGGHFCGKESTITIHVHPADMPKYLPKPHQPYSPEDIEARRLSIPGNR